MPETRYARSGDVNIAYQVFGEGEVPLVWVPGFTQHIELSWEEPNRRAWFEGLGRFARVLVLDKRGTGLSDRVEGSPPLPGECEVVDGKVGGIAVHIGVAAEAGAGEVLVSSTVKDLVAGSGLAFKDRGAAELKGVPGEWRLRRRALSRRLERGTEIRKAVEEAVERS